MRGTPALWIQKQSRVAGAVVFGLLVVVEYTTVLRCLFSVQECVRRNLCQVHEHKKIIYAVQISRVRAPCTSIMQWLSHANALRLRIVLPLGPDVLHNNYSNKWIGVCSLSLDPPAAAFCRTISRPVPCISSESHRFRQGFSQREGSRGARRGKEGTHRRAGVVRPSEVAVAGGRGGEWQVPL